MRLQNNIWGRRGHWLTLLLYFAVTLPFFSQGGFQKYLKLPGSLDAVAADVLEAPNGNFIVAGFSEEVIKNQLVNKLVIMATDSTGGMLWIKKHGSLSIDYPDAWHYLFFCADLNNFFLICPVRDSVGAIAGSILKISYDGAILWEKKISDSSAKIYPMAMTRSVDNGFYVTGTFFPTSGGQPVFVSKLDANGNELWRKVIHKGPPNVTDAKCIIQDTISKKLIICGYQFIGSSTYNSVLFLDSNANKIKQVSYTNSCGGATARMIQLQDGNFMIGTQIAVDCDNGIYKGVLYKFNHMGDLLWTYTHSNSGPGNGLEIVEELENGSLVTVGYLDDSYNVHAQYIIISKEGKVVMKKNFGRSKSEMQNDWLRGGSVTRDGGYIRAIQLTYEPSPTPFYFVKLDSLGCDTTPEYCASQVVGLYEQGQQLSAELFPNPCNSSLFIKLPVTGAAGNYVITAQSGVALCRGSFKGAEASINTSELAEGLYVIELSSGEGVLRRKFAVMR